MASNEETNAAGTDTRPPMLVESDYDSWKIRIHRYIRGKPNGKQIWKSIQNGPTPHPMITDPPPTDSAAVPAPRKKLDSEFSEEENKLEMADTQAEIILSQGLPRHIFNNLNQTSTAKEIWDNVEMLMQGSGKTLQQRKEDLFDEYERFRAIGNESIHDYFVRFHKLVNDMKITQLNILTHQMNTKFVNNLPAYWDANLLSGFPKAVFHPPTTTLRTSSNSRTHATVHDGTELLLNQFRGGSRHWTKITCFNAHHEDAMTQTCMKAPICVRFHGQLVHHTNQPINPVTEYLLDTEAQNVPTEVSADTSDKVSMIAILTDLQTQLDGHAKKELSGDQAYWLFANEIASQDCKPATPATPFVHKSQPPSQVLASLQKVNAVFHQFEEQRYQLYLAYFRYSCAPSSTCPLRRILELQCDREHTKVHELNSEISKSKQKQLITESEKRFAFLEQNYVSLQLKFQNYKQCIDTSSASNAIFEINKLRQQLQGKDDTIRNLDAQINIMKVLNVGTTEGSCDQQALETDRIQLKDTITSLRIQLDGLKVENVSLKRRYDELSKANTHSRTAYTEKLSAFTAENTKLKAQVTGTTSSGPSTSETPKVLAPGMYNLGSKYIPPPKRANWVKPTPLPKKKQVTFSEPPRPSLKPTQKPVVHPNKQTNVCVPMSTGVKPTSGASKTVPKRAPRNHSSLPVKSANARKVEAHHRTLNKKNRVDSNLLVKHSVSVSKMNNVCGACNKSLVFANHTDCLVMCDGSVNVKPHQTKRFKRQPRKEWKPVKKVWKPISKPVANSKPQWKPTGRHFSLFEKHPLTRIMESTDQPIELPPSASSSPKITMVVQIVLWYLDSGCSRHMTGDRARLINFVEKFIGTVRFGNDEYAAIIGYGDYKLGDTIISRVYYVEGLKHNLFSVGQFCDGGLEVAFRQHSCHIRNYICGSPQKGHDNQPVIHLTE
ncbi:hypothetical protein Tco_0281064 [Tanacetum coccineum]